MNSKIEKYLISEYTDKDLHREMGTVLDKYSEASDRLFKAIKKYKLENDVFHKMRVQISKMDDNFIQMIKDIEKEINDWI